MAGPAGLMQFPKSVADAAAVFAYDQGRAEFAVWPEHRKKTNMRWPV